MSTVERNTLRATKAVGTPEGLIARTLSERGRLTGAQLARLTGLAKSTVSASLTVLRRSGLVIEVPGERGSHDGAGRPGTLLTLNPEAGTCVGVLVELGTVQVVVADVSHAVICSITEEVPLDYPPLECAKVIRGLVERCYQEHSLNPAGLLGVGVSVVAPVNPVDGRVQRASALPSWTGINIQEAFEPILGRPVIAGNESNCAALAEMMWGAARGRDEFLLIKVGGGIGGAIVHRGEVLTGAAGGAGEFGHMVIDPSGELCRCGNRGCFEMMASLRATMRRAGLEQLNRAAIDHVVAQAVAGDVGSRRLVSDTATAVGLGLAMIGTVLDPKLIVVGGSLAQAGELMLAPLIASYEKHTLVKQEDVPAEARTRIVAGQLLEFDSCLGAVGLVLRQHDHQAT